MHVGVRQISRGGGNRRRDGDEWVSGQMGV